ncbi:MAG: hypothetical protein WA160_00210 [Pseudobdellovibrio sp.]
MDQANTTSSDKNIELSNQVHQDTSNGRFEQSRQKLTEDLSLKEIAKIFTSNWPLFLIIFCLTSILSISVYIYKIPFVSNGTILVNDTQNSSLQSFATQFFGLTKTVADGKKNNSPLLKHIEFLKTEEFFNQLLTDIQKRGLSDQLTLNEKVGFQQFKIAFLKSNLTEADKLKVLQALDAMSKFKLNSDFELNVAFSSLDKEMALFLTNTALVTIAETLKQRELFEIVKVETFIKTQKESAEKNMAGFNQELAAFQNKPENLISLSSKDKVGEYLSDLMVRKNEIKMKIAENKKMIDYLSQGKTQRRESQLYSSSGRVQNLVLENKLYLSKLSDLQTTINQVSNQAKTIPVATLAFDDLKKKSEVEFNKYKDLTDALAKAEAQKLSTDNRFEILEKSRFDKVLPLVSLLVMLLLSIVVSQTLGSLIIYIIYIWDSNTVTAQTSRNVVIIDSHSLDPRVIIENSKIRFNLKHVQYDDDSSSQNKISFNVESKKSINGDINENT